MTDDFVLTPPELSESRFATFKDLIFRGYNWKHGISPGWDVRDATQLKRHLAANPEETIGVFGQTLLNYFRSEDHSSGERPFRFLPRLDCYRVKPQNAFRRDQDAKIETAQSQRQRRNLDAIDLVCDKKLPQGYAEDVSPKRIDGRRSRALGTGFEPISSPRD